MNTTHNITADSSKNVAFELFTSITINASAESVWKVLTDFEQYPEWNPFIKEIRGISFEPGGQIFAHIDNMKFKPIVQIYKENHIFEWLGKLFIKGLFDGRHRFELVENADGSTTLHHSEKFSGILVGLMKKKLDTEIRDSFEAMNVALKRRVEGQESRV
ncbi:SRPBCC domain-containing protein [Sanyastnella coralliicola]|uniref:SRPBCC domain-containing protein n=1 Tax=Sanyastnella coralliicola TaxID=3069118 RepID=UPI0027B9AE91|nr:SRPBCC domain-containing protein [Longitalea sp. SCSIO 12813]